jgi:tetratricopeptide (TPR) repeat protein
MSMVITLTGEDALTFEMKADEAFFAQDYPRAITLYDSALRETPSDAVVLWKLARAWVCRGESVEGAERRDAFQRAETSARLCIAADSTMSPGHAWLAASLGYLTLEASGSDKIPLVREVLRESGAALRWDPRNDVAYSVRGSTFRALGNVGWLQRQLAALFFGGLPSGGFPEAEEALRKAILLAPQVMRHHYELGVLYLDWGKREEARKALQTAVELPVRVAIDRPRLDKARQFLRDLKAAE